MRNLNGYLDIDKHIRRQNLKRYLLQCSLAGVVVLILLFILDAVTQTVLIAALGGRYCFIKHPEEAGPARSHGPGLRWLVTRCANRHQSVQQTRQRQVRRHYFRSATARISVDHLIPYRLARVA